MSEVNQYPGDGMGGDVKSEEGKYYDTPATVQADAQSEAGERMAREKRWGKEAHKAFADRRLSYYHSEYDFVMGYLQACKARQEEIERLEKRIEKLNQLCNIAHINTK